MEFLFPRCFIFFIWEVKTFFFRFGMIDSIVLIIAAAAAVAAPYCAHTFLMYTKHFQMLEQQ